MIFIVYKTTNLINNKFYIGKHNQKIDANLFDGYLGSGATLKKAITKYGKHNFSRVTIQQFESESDAYQFEIKLVEENKTNPLCYNIRPGGTGRSYNASDITRGLQSKSAYQRWHDPVQYDAMLTERKTRKSRNPQWTNNVAESVSDLWKDPEYVLAQQASRTSTEYRANASIKAKNRQKYQCVHCNQMFQPSHLTRWHGDKCKSNPANQ